MGFNMKRLIFFVFFMAFSLYAEQGFIEPWGRDAKMVPRKNFIPPLPQKRNLLVKLAHQVILFHQNVLSPVDGPRSHFRPTSSRYMFLAMHRFGFLKGFIMGCDRLLRENKEAWVYRTITIDGQIYKWDPTY